MTILVFVYGSLKKGFYNHGLIESCKFIRNAKINGATMVGFGRFPGLIDGNSDVSGEIYEVDHHNMQKLDRLEGHPHFYERRIVQCIDGAKEKVWVYFLNDPHQKEVESNFDRYEIIIDGIWKETR